MERANGPARGFDIRRHLHGNRIAVKDPRVIHFREIVVLCGKPEYRNRRGAFLSQLASQSHRRESFEHCVSRTAKQSNLLSRYNRNCVWLS